MWTQILWPDKSTTDRIFLFVMCFISSPSEKMTTALPGNCDRVCVGQTRQENEKSGLCTRSVLRGEKEVVYFAENTIATNTVFFFFFGGGGGSCCSSFWAITKTIGGVRRADQTAPGNIGQAKSQVSSVVPRWLVVPVILPLLWQTLLVSFPMDTALSTTLLVFLHSSKIMQQPMLMWQKKVSSGVITPVWRVDVSRVSYFDNLLR